MTARNLRYLIAAVILCVAPACFAAQTQMTLVGPGSNGHLGITPVYIGPYVADIGPSNTPVQVICDDYFDETYIPETWTANIFDLSNLTGTIFGPSGLHSDPAYQAGYQQVAWLSQQLVQQTFFPTLVPGAHNALGDIQYAIWAVFDPAALNNISGADHTNAVAWLNAAQAHYSTGDYSNVSIYTPDTTSLISCGGHACEFTPPQEFVLVRTSEPGAIAILFVDLSAVGILVFLFRRRLIRH